MKLHKSGIYMYLQHDIHNKAIRDDKHLARHMPVLGNVQPIKIEKFDIFSWRHFSARLSFYILIDRATQEVPM